MIAGVQTNPKNGAGSGPYESPKRKGIKTLFDIAFLVLCVFVAYFLSNYLFMSVPIVGPSMETTIHDKDTVILYRRGEYHVGDIVIFDNKEIEENTSGDPKRLIKRIVGLPGDEIAVKQDAEDGQYYLYRNGEKILEDYTNDYNPMSAVTEPVIVPEGKFFFMGDNRGVSLDSRTTGVMGELNTILGRVIVRYQRTEDNKFDFSFVKRGK